MQRAALCQLDGDEKGALDHMKRAVEIYPSYVAAWNNIGTHYHLKGDYERAVRNFTKAIELDADFAVGWINLAGSLLASGKFKDAVEAGKKGLNLGASDAVANSQLAMSHYYLRDFRQAEKHFQRVLELDPAFSPAPQLYLAQIAVAEKSWTDAVRYFQSYLAIHPNAPDADQIKRMLAISMENAANRLRYPS